MEIKGITIQSFCDFHHVEQQQILAIVEFGLIEVERQEEHIIIPEKQVEHLERFLRLVNELGVNLEGVEVIDNMRAWILRLQSELNKLYIQAGISDQIQPDDEYDIFLGE